MPSDEPVEPPLPPFESPFGDGLESLFDERDGGGTEDECGDTVEDEWFDFADGVAQYTVMAFWDDIDGPSMVDLVGVHGGDDYFTTRRRAEDYLDRQRRLDSTLPTRWSGCYGSAPERYQVAVRKVVYSHWLAEDEVADSDEDAEAYTATVDLPPPV